MLLAMDYREAAEIPSLFYEDMAAYGEAPLLPVLESMGWRPLQERLD